MDYCIFGIYLDVNNNLSLIEEMPHMPSEHKKTSHLPMAAEGTRGPQKSAVADFGDIKLGEKFPSFQRSIVFVMPSQKKAMQEILGIKDGK